MQLATENWSVNWTTVNCPRGGDKKQCQIPTWGGGVGHEIDKCINQRQCSASVHFDLAFHNSESAPAVQKALLLSSLKIKVSESGTC